MSDMLAGLGRVWVYLAEYRITHGYLHLLITDRSFTRLADVYFSDTVRICGPTFGGPWAVRVDERVVDGGVQVVFADADGVIEIVALKVHVDLVDAGRGARGRSVD